MIRKINRNFCLVGTNSTEALHRAMTRAEESPARFTGFFPKIVMLGKVWSNTPLEKLLLILTHILCPLFWKKVEFIEASFNSSMLPNKAGKVLCTHHFWLGTSTKYYIWKFLPKSRLAIEVQAEQQHNSGFLSKKLLQPESNLFSKVLQNFNM